MDSSRREPAPEGTETDRAWLQAQAEAQQQSDEEAHTPQLILQDEKGSPRRGATSILDFARHNPEKWMPPVGWITFDLYTSGLVYIVSNRAVDTDTNWWRDYTNVDQVEF